MIKVLLGVAGWIVFFVLIGAAIYRLPINGWNILPWIASMLAINIIRAPYAKRTARNEVVKSTNVSVEKVLLALVFLGASFIPIIHLATGVLSFASYKLPIWAAIFGAVMLLPGLWLFWRSHVDLGRNWSVTTELHDEQTLVTNGVYNRVRHPMYTAIWILFLAQPLLVQNWIAGLSGPITFAILYLVRVPYEEAMMVERFGKQYSEYKQRSGRLWP